MQGIGKLSGLIIVSGMLAGCQTAMSLKEAHPARWMVCANDQLYTQVNGDEHVYEKPGTGSLTIMDVSCVPPRSVIQLADVPGSLIGPPTSVAVTPDQRYALVTGAMKLNPANRKEQVPGNTLSVIRLAAGRSEIVQQLTLGRQPSGVEISRDGTRALAANRADGSVSLLSLSKDGRVDPLGTFQVAEAGSSVSHAAFSPDGHRVLVTLNKAKAVLFCSLEKDRLEVLQKIAAGDGPYCAEFTPDGKSAVIGNVYEGSLMVLEIGDRNAAVVDTVPVGILAEGVDISPDGNWMVVNCLENTNMKPGKPAHRNTAMVVLLQKQGQTFVVMDSIRVAGIPQSAVFTPDGRYVAVASNEEKSIRFYKLENGELRETAIEVKCSGGPAAMRISM